MTCDNASSNNVMMNELEFLLAHFEGQGTRVQCILHIGNLVAKSMLKQFNVPHNRRSIEWAPEDEELHILAEGLDVEDDETIDAISSDLRMMTLMVG